MIDLSKPEIRQAYLLGIETAKAEMAVEMDRVAVVTETRIVRQLDQFRRKLIAERSPQRSEIVAKCIRVVQGEVVNDD
jgi:hypothetical protein